jgi:hypothetical protein
VSVSSAVLLQCGNDLRSRLSPFVAVVGVVVVVVGVVLWWQRQRPQSAAGTAADLWLATLQRRRVYEGGAEVSADTRPTDRTPKAGAGSGTGHPEGVTLKRALALVGWCAVAVAVAVAVRRLPLPLPSPLPSSLPFAVGGGGCRCRRRWSSALVSLPCGAVVFVVRRCGRVRLSFLPLPCGAVVVIAVHCGLRCGALWACAAVLCDISSRGLNVGKRVGGSPLVILLVICRARWGCAKQGHTFEINK